MKLSQWRPGIEAIKTFIVSACDHNVRFQNQFTALLKEFQFDQTAPRVCVVSRECNVTGNKRNNPFTSSGFFYHNSLGRAGCLVSFCSPRSNRFGGYSYQPDVHPSVSPQTHSCTFHNSYILRNTCSLIIFGRDVGQIQLACRG